VNIVFKEERIIWRYSPDPDDVDLYGDIAEEYAIEQSDEAHHGIILWYKHRGSWAANPFSTRPVIVQLLRDLQIIRRR